MSLRLVPNLRLSLFCGVCEKPRDEEAAQSAMLDVILNGQEPFATCPSCNQKVANFQDPEYQERARTYFEQGESQMNADASAAPNVIKDDVWLDLDPRAKGRKIKVLSVEEGVARCKRVTGTGPVTKIRLDRFKPSREGKGKKGFKLVTRAKAVLDAAAAGRSPVVQEAGHAGGLGTNGHDGVMREAMNELHPGIDLD